MLVYTFAIAKRQVSTELMGVDYKAAVLWICKMLLFFIARDRLFLFFSARQSILYIYAIEMLNAAPRHLKDKLT